MHLILDFGVPMSWMSFAAIWIAAICIVDSQELKIRNVVMSSYWLFLGSGSIFVLPATRKEWLLTNVLDAIPGASIAVHTYGDFLNSNPHLHTIVSDGYSAILTKAIREWPVDSVMMPINPVEAALGGFMDMALKTALEKNIAVIGIKVLGSSHYIAPDAGMTPPGVLNRFALSQAITVAIVGCSNVYHVRTLSAAGRNFSPLSVREQQDIVGLYNAQAKQLAFYRGVL